MSKIPFVVFYRYALWVLIVLGICSCSSVKVRKIGSDNKVTGPQGFRYYLPRPYVCVYEPFAISSNAYLLQGTLTPNGQFVRLQTDGLPDRLAQHFIKGKGDAVAIPTANIGLSYPSNDSSRSTTNGVQVSYPVGSKTAEVVDKPETAEELSDQSDKRGIQKMSVKTDNAAFAVTPTRRFFDILFLPDFDEQYFIISKSRLGNSSMDMVYGQGWSLQSFEAFMDNSEVVDRTFDFYDNSLKLLMNYAGGRMGLALPKGFMDGMLGGLQSAPEPGLDDKIAEGSLTTETPITLKVHIIKMAAPGLYPILKPSELSNLTVERIREMQEIAGIVGSTQEILLPVPPFTNIAYNVYEVIIVEAVVPFDESTIDFTGHKNVYSREDSFSYDPEGNTDGANAFRDHTVALIAALENPGIGEKIEAVIFSKADKFSAPIKLDVQITAKPGAIINAEEKAEIVNTVIRIITTIEEFKELDGLTADHIQLILL